MIDPMLMKFLACPACGCDLKKNGKGLACSNEKCKKRFKIVGGIPILLMNREMYGEDMKLTVKMWEKRYQKVKDEYNPDNPPKEVEMSSGYVRRFFGFNGSGTRKFFMEAGCGTARTSLELSKQKELTIICLDISLSALLEAKAFFRENHKKAYFICGDMKNLPIKDNKLDFIFSDGAIEHFRGTEKAISEFWRVIKSCGRVFATVPYFSISMLVYGQLQGNIPNVPVLRNISEFVHMSLFNQKYMKNGYELSFTRSKIKNLFNIFDSVETGHYDVFNEIRFFRNQTIKKVLRKLAKSKMFWPLIYVYAQKH